ncbi:hypothetical protein B0H34DRAFT_51389 [Crassisporium funariophilum]|nr:hypothetical protein B0H34DRAFT_51389 [Crassisporium funariophilum]
MTLQWNKTKEPAEDERVTVDNAERLRNKQGKLRRMLRSRKLALKRDAMRMRYIPAWRKTRMSRRRNLSPVSISSNRCSFPADGHH